MKYCEKRASKKKKKKDAPMNVCDRRIRFDKCVCIEFQRRGTQFELRLECVLFKD